MESNKRSNLIMNGGTGRGATAGWMDGRANGPSWLWPRLPIILVQQQQ